jgi:hypothetical protein
MRRSDETSSPLPPPRGVPRRDPGHSHGGIGQRTGHDGPYKVEVLAIERSGNQTLSEIAFTVR